MLKRTYLFTEKSLRTTCQNAWAHCILDVCSYLTRGFNIAGGNTSDLGNIDGINQWPYLTDITTKPPRKEILINIDEVKGEHAIIDGNWKVIKGTIEPNLLFFIVFVFNQIV